ncbi:MAG TPA: protoglobin domain-containing protein, partial [Microthrixaceae bacterium]|nr:protoglobin domain-containing protein [Microthrixaceae bacterium]
MTTDIAAYTYGNPDLDRSPVSLDDLQALQQSLLWSDSDREALRRAGAILVPQTEDILDVWYGFVGGTSHLVATFAGADGEPDGDYLGRVRARFGQWIA